MAMTRKIISLLRRTSLTLQFLVLSLPICGLASGEEISFATTDDVRIHGDIYWTPERSKNAPLILLFHQGGGDSRGEYAPLAPRLLAEGYNLLAIDQRRGGDRFGGINRTVAATGSAEYAYCDAYADLEAALSFASEYGFSGPFIAWGSSYSAALVFKLAALHPDQIDVVLAFSPAAGEAMAGCQPDLFSGEVSQPLLALRPASEMEVPYVPGQMAAFRSDGHKTYVADPGVHGASMLNSARVGGVTADTWTVVLDFIRDALSSGPEQPAH